MNKIVAKDNLSDRVVRFEVEAPLIAKSRKPGHFVIVRVGKKRGGTRSLYHCLGRP